MTNYCAVVDITHTNMCMDCYKFVIIPNPYIVSKIGMRLAYVLGQVRMQVETIIHVFGIRYHTF